MDKLSFLDRARTIVPKGAMTGAKWGLLLFVGYIVVVTVVLFIDTVFISGTLEFVGLSLFALSMCALGALPWTFAGLIEGGIIGLILSVFRKKPSGWAACFIGLFVGVAFVLFANYIYWQVSTYPNLKVPFFEYLFHINTSSFFSLISVNEYSNS